LTRFFATNVLVYAQRAVPHSAVARAVLSEGGVISVQVLNEFTNVLRRKLRRSCDEIEEVLDDVAMLLPPPLALTAATHRVALGISRDAGYAFYDSLILASALEAGARNW
jgi:predicted nucleic acid-binding protein